MEYFRRAQYQIVMKSAIGFNVLLGYGLSKTRQKQVKSRIALPRKHLLAVATSDRILSCKGSSGVYVGLASGVWGLISLSTSMLDCP